MKIRTLKLSPALDRRLSRYAGRRGVSLSFVVREALAGYLDDDRPAEGSFADQAADLAGIVSGAPDLSTNPEYLDGYGRGRR